MANQQTEPILICGAGPTGLSLAIELARRQVPVRIIDKKKSISPFSKALGIQARTLEYLFMMGCVDLFLDPGRKLTNFNVNLAGHKIAATFDGLQTRYPFVLILGQNKTEEFLTKRLREIGVTVELNTELNSITDNGNTAITAHLDHEGNETTEDFSYIIGCDGPRSFVRSAMGAEFTGKTYAEEFLLVDGQSKDAPREWQLTIAKNQVNLLIPMPDCLRAVVNVPMADMKNNTDETAAEIVNDLYRYQDKSGQRTEFQSVAWASRFRIHQRLASTYHSGRLLLAGDSAHVHSPAGGQGMNTGIGDAVNLGWKLAAVWKGEASVNLLGSYQHERRPIAEEVLRSTDVFTKLSTGSGIWSVARQVAGPIAKLLAASSQRLPNRISQLDIKYKERSFFSSKAIGTRFWQSFVTIDGQSTDSLSLLEGHWLVLCFSDVKFTPAGDTGMNYKWFQVATTREHAQTLGALYDTSATYNGLLIIIRPDGHVYDVSSLPNGSEVQLPKFC